MSVIQVHKCDGCGIERRPDKYKPKKGVDWQWVRIWYFSVAWYDGAAVLGHYCNNCWAQMLNALPRRAAQEPK